MGYSPHGFVNPERGFRRLGALDVDTGSIATEKMGWHRRSTLLAFAAGATLGCSLVVDTGGLTTDSVEGTGAAFDGGASDAPLDVGPDVGPGGFGLPKAIATTLPRPSYVVADRDRVYVLTDSRP
jgi:hypothetical protein